MASKTICKPRKEEKNIEHEFATFFIRCNAICWQVVVFTLHSTWHVEKHINRIRPLVTMIFPSSFIVSRSV